MDSIGLLDSHPWEKQENPQTYDLLKFYGEHHKPAQHMLGMIGGNNVPYKTREIQVDTESDLRGITRANTFCPSRQHKPTSNTVTTIQRDTPKQKVSIPLATTPLKQSQLWAYPATLAPEPFVIESCMRPEKY